MTGNGRGPRFDAPGARLALLMAGQRLNEQLDRVRPGEPELGPLPTVRSADRDGATDVDSYWGGHTVQAPAFGTVRSSERDLERRFKQYPLFREFSGLWGEHDGETILDYGCGPGNDVAGFAIHSRAEKIVGVDISEKALGLAAHRLALHHVDPGRIELVHVSDSEPRVPLADDSVDHLNCQGVIMVTTDPQVLLEEFARVLRPGGTGCVMIYNRNSLWFHLYTAYQKMIVENAFPELSIDAAFTRNTDGPECPVSRAWTAETFGAMCERAGLGAEYVGGYPSLIELSSLQRHWAQALADPRLDAEHRSFLRELSFDPHGYPVHKGFHAGIGGVYRLTSH